MRILRARVTRRRRWWLAAPLLCLLAYGAWPYLALLHLSQAASDPDPAALAGLVDLDAVREEIRRRLNKTASSAIGKVSDGFIQWLEQGIQRLGTDALDRIVTLSWVQERLNTGVPPGQTLLGQVGHAFFDSPTGFRVRLRDQDHHPVHFRMTLQGVQWRLTALYY